MGDRSLGRRVGGAAAGPGPRISGVARRGPLTRDLAEHRVGGPCTQRHRGLAAHPKRQVRGRGRVAGRRSRGVEHRPQAPRLLQGGDRTGELGRTGTSISRSAARAASTSGRSPPWPVDEPESCGFSCATTGSSLRPTGRAGGPTTSLRLLRFQGFGLKTPPDRSPLTACEADRTIGATPACSVGSAGQRLGLTQVRSRTGSFPVAKYRLT